MSIKICIGLVDVVLWPKILDNRLGILTSVLIAMDYFFWNQKCTFNLENNKCISQRNFFVYHVTGSTYSSIIFLAMYIYLKDTYKTMKRIREVQFVSELRILTA